jgi:hypothetical protein
VKILIASVMEVDISNKVLARAEKKMLESA